METSSGSAFVIIFMLIIFAGLAATVFSVISKSKNANKPRPPYPPPDDRDPFTQNKPDGTNPQGNNPWRNQNAGHWGPYDANKPGGNWTYKQNGQPLQPPQKTEAETGEAMKAEEKARIQKERELERQRRIAEASNEVQKHYQAPWEDGIGNVPPQRDAVQRDGFADKAVPKAIREEETGNAPRQTEALDNGLEALEFEAETERQNLAILQGSGAMETGRIAKVESVSENYCRITFALQTFEGTFFRYAVVKKDEKFVPDTAHYILLDKEDKDRCTVL